MDTKEQKPTITETHPHDPTTTQRKEISNVEEENAQTSEPNLDSFLPLNFAETVTLETSSACSLEAIPPSSNDELQLETVVVDESISDVAQQSHVQLHEVTSQSQSMIPSSLGVSVDQGDSHVPDSAESANSPSMETKVESTGDL